MNTGPKGMQALSSTLSVATGSVPSERETTSSSLQEIPHLKISHLTISQTSSSPTQTATFTAPTPLSNTAPKNPYSANINWFTTQIFFSISSSSPSINQFCSAATPCSCKFSWSETNSTVNPPITYKRTAQTLVTTVQSGMILCAAPSIYDSEISDQTPITIEVIPNGSTPSFETSSYVYLKNASNTSSNLQLMDIFHYACFQKTTRGTSIFSKQFSANSPTNTTSTAKSAYASQFCIASAQSSNTPTATSDSSCPSPTYQRSAQSYYYQLYIQSSEKGNINLSNQNLECPQVIPSLDSSNSYWPMDSQFRLATANSAVFNVGVQGNALINIGNTSGTLSTCFASSSNSTASSPSNSSNNGAATGMVSTCLGYAASPNPNGTCPIVKDPIANTNLQTYRLRRYLAIYPNFLDTNGEPIPGNSQGIDTLFVIDRPVQAPLTANVNESYTMLGPKPCPFAYYDPNGIVSGTPGYFSSGDSRWLGKNIDGIRFPNQDGILSSGYSCSTILPLRVFSTAGSLTGFTLKTLKPSESLYTRPIAPFIPHYEEDTSFQACAPLSEQFREAPLHFALEPNSKNVSWCTEAYPTENPLLANSAYYSTAHGSSYDRIIDKNNLTGSPESSTTKATPIPLLAPASAIEAEIIQDKSYQCLITYDGPIPAKVGLKTPSSGCCQMSTSPVKTGGNQTGGHLEPSIPCGIPVY